jgi:hypothetical protein
VLSLLRRPQRDFVPLTEDTMTTTPRLWKPQTQVNTADSGAQTDGQIAATHDGGYVVIWHSFNFTIGQRYDSAGNKISGEVITSFSGGEQPAVTVLANGNIAVAVADTSTPSIYVNIFSPTWGSPLRTDFIDGGTDLSSPSITPFAGGSYVISYTDGAGFCRTAISLLSMRTSSSAVPPTTT